MAPDPMTRRYLPLSGAAPLARRQLAAVSLMAR